MTFRTVEKFEIAHKRVVIRADLNVPMQNQIILNAERLHSILPTVEYCLRQNAEVVLVSHLGRPKGRRDPKFSLRPVAAALEQLLNHPVNFIRDWRRWSEQRVENHNTNPKPVNLLENVRFEPGEESNSATLGQEFATLGDLYVMEAFGTLHRAHASTAAAVTAAKQVGIGFLLDRELRMLSAAMEKPKRPFVVIIGGAKVSSKFAVMHELVSKANSILIGGGMANTFLYSQNFATGTSIIEREFCNQVKTIIDSRRVEIPHDVMVSESPLDNRSVATHRLVDEVRTTEMIADIGPDTARRYATRIKQAGTVVWNGPMGVFEYDQFGEGTRIVGEAIGDSTAFTLAGGGETIAAIARNNLVGKLDYISTGGGAFLEFIQGKPLPGIDALRNHPSQQARLDS